MKFGLKPREAADITAPQTQDFDTKRQEAADSIAFAQVAMKARYDSKHKPWIPTAGQEVYLRLENYNIPGMTNRKLIEKRIGLFLIKRMVGELACELNFPKNWKVNPVISIAELEPLPDRDDPYHRPKRRTTTEPLEHGIPQPDKLLDARERRVGRNKLRITEFRVRWKDQGAEHDTWVREDDLDEKLVKKFRRSL